MPYIVPSPTPAPRTGFGDFAQGLGGGTQKFQDLLLQAILNGQLAPRQQGAYTSPTGATTTISPAEVSVRGNVPFNTLMRQGQNRPQGSSYKPIGSLEYLPPLNRQLQQAQLSQANQEIAQGPAKLKSLEADTAMKTSQAGWYKALTSGGGSATGAVFDSATGGIRPVLPGEEPQFLITPTKSGKTITSLAPTNKINAEMEAEKQKQEDASTFVKESAADALDTITEIEKGIQHFGTFGQLPSIPGTERSIWESNVNKLLSGKVLQVMDAMKRASKAGGTGFGQLSNKELVVLQQASTALKKQLPPAEAQKILNDMKVKLSKIAQNELGATTKSGAGVTPGGLKYTIEE